MEDASKELHVRLKFAREKANLTQKKISELLGVTEKTIINPCGCTI